VAADERIDISLTHSREYAAAVAIRRGMRLDDIRDL
jgi:phosphopantetheinyl transferase (holo-ACP synthase)